MERDTRETRRVKIKDERRPGWHWAYHEIIDEYGAKLGPYGLAIYYALCRHAGDDRSCYPSYSTLAKETGMSRPQAIRAMKRVVEEGLVVKESRRDEAGHATSNRYILVDLDADKEDGIRETPPGKEEIPVVVSDSDEGGIRGVPKGEPTKENHINDSDDVLQNLKILKDAGVNDPLLTEIAESHDTAWVRAAIVGVHSPGGIVHRHRQGWQPTAKGRRSKPRRGSKEDRYRYFKGEDADHVEHWRL